MRILLVMWFAPLALFWGWYGLSANDYNFGFVILSRGVHDLVFQIYGNMLGVEASKIPGIVAWACAADSAIVLAIAAFRWRKSWFPRTKALLHRFWNDLEAEQGRDYGDFGLDEDDFIPGSSRRLVQPVRVRTAE